jgi:hypothetical protein
MSNKKGDHPVQPSNVNPVDVAGSLSTDRCLFRPSDFYVLSILLAIFWVGVLRHIELPGLYMDAINPDYLAAGKLNPEIHNPVWIIPTARFPILGNLYHGVQTYYLALPIDAVFGMNIVSVRLGQALFGAVIIALSFAIVVRTTGNRLLAFVAAAGLATDIAFIASFRTQNYIILAGEVWLLASILCLLRPGPDGRAAWRPFLSGVCFGLAAYGYFVFLFFGPAILWLAGSTATGKTKRDLAIWIGGVAAGMLPYVAGYLSLIAALGSVSNAITWIQATLHNLKPFSSQLSIWGDVINACHLAQYATTNLSNELMLLGVGSNALWPNLRLVCIVLLLRTCHHTLIETDVKPEPPDLRPANFLTVRLHSVRVAAWHASVGSSLFRPHPPLLSFRCDRSRRTHGRHGRSTARYNQDLPKDHLRGRRRRAVHERAPTRPFLFSA